MCAGCSQRAIAASMLAGVTPQHSNPPIGLPNSYDEVRRAIDELAAPVTEV